MVASRYIFLTHAAPWLPDVVWLGARLGVKTHGTIFGVRAFTTHFTYLSGWIESDVHWPTPRDPLLPTQDE